MGEAIRNILVKFEQQQRIASQFSGGQLFDAVGIVAEKEHLTYDHFDLLE
jgi:hypothetical protein